MIAATSSVDLDFDVVAQVWRLSCSRCGGEVLYSRSNGQLARVVADAHETSCDG